MASHLSKIAAPEIAVKMAFIHLSFHLQKHRLRSCLGNKIKVLDCSDKFTKPFHCKTKAIGLTQENPRLYSREILNKGSAKGR